MSEYQVGDGATIVRLRDGAFIPPDPDNRDYVEYLKYTADGGETDAYVAPPPAVPQEISDRQFFQQLALEGIITQAQALASNAAVIPPPLMTLINAMPQDQQFNARMIISGATSYRRDAALTVAIGAAYGWSAQQIDDFFRAAASL